MQRFNMDPTSGRITCTRVSAVCRIDGTEGSALTCNSYTLLLCMAWCCSLHAGQYATQGYKHLDKVRRNRNGPRQPAEGMGPQGVVQPMQCEMRTEGRCAATDGLRTNLHLCSAGTSWWIMCCCTASKRWVVKLYVSCTHQGPGAQGPESSCSTCAICLDVTCT